MKRISEKFNDKAQNLGCSARIELKRTKRKGIAYVKTVMLEFSGSEQDGHEIWYPIDLNRFGQLINKYPELHNV